MHETSLLSGCHKQAHVMHTEQFRDGSVCFWHTSLVALVSVRKNLNTNNIVITVYCNNLNTAKSNKCLECRTLLMITSFKNLKPLNWGDRCCVGSELKLTTEATMAPLCLELCFSLWLHYVMAKVAALSLCSASVRLKNISPFLPRSPVVWHYSRFHSNIKGLLVLRCYKMWQHFPHPCGPSVLLVSSPPAITTPLLVNTKTTLPLCPPISSNLLDVIWFWPQFAGCLDWILPLPKAEVFLSTIRDTFMAQIETERKISVQAGMVAVCLCDFRGRKHECQSRAAFFFAVEPSEAATLCWVVWTIGFQPP